MNRLAHLLNQEPTPEQWEKFNRHHIQENPNRVAIKRGCENDTCFCTGKCDEIIGYREKHPLENKWLGNMSKDEHVKANEDYQRLVELDEQQTEKK